MTASPQNSQNKQLTIWIWPSGLYPARLTYYLHAKGLPVSCLWSETNPNGLLKLIPIKLDMSVPGLVSAKPGLEDRPAGTSMPLLRVGDSNASASNWIRESVAVLDYMEEVYPSEAGYIDLRGNTPELRSHGCDIMNLLTELMVWSNVAVRHTHEWTTSWSGMTKDELSSSAAKDGVTQVKKLLAKLEGWVRHDIMDHASLSLTGVMDRPMLPDFAMISAVEYLREVYSWDMLYGFGVLQTWYSRYKESKFWISRLSIRQIEEDASFRSLCVET